MRHRTAAKEEAADEGKKKKGGIGQSYEVSEEELGKLMPFMYRGLL